MRFAILFGLGTALLSTTACAPQAAAPQEVASSSSDTCTTPETGIISPESTGVPDVRLKGPFLLKSLNVVVDPANPNTYGSVMWSKNEAWIKIDTFRGEFYLAEGETLSAKVNFSPWKTVYSGCRLEEAAQ